MNIISKKSTVMSLALVGLIAGSTPMTARALLPDLTKKQMLVAFGLASFFWTACKEAVAKPAVITEQDWKKLAQVQNILTQKYWENVLHLINDGYIGQAGIRGKAVLGITNEEDGSMMFKEVNALPSTGICGNALFAIKLVGKKAKDLVSVLAVPGAFVTLWNAAEKVSKGEFKAEEPKADAAK